MSGRVDSSDAIIAVPLVTEHIRVRRIRRQVLITDAARTVNTLIISGRSRTRSLRPRHRSLRSHQFFCAEAFPTKASDFASKWIVRKKASDGRHPSLTGIQTVPRQLPALLNHDLRD